MSLDGDNLLDMEKELEIKSLRTEISDLKKKIAKYEVIMKEADLEFNASDISDEEIICLQQIKRLRDISEHGELSKDDVQKLDILHRNLKLARGEDVRVKAKGKVGKMSSAELTDLLKG